MPDIVANSVLPADRQPLRLLTSDGHTLIGELALPLNAPIRGTVICMHPLPTHGGMMDSHVLRKMSWRLPALAGIAVLRFNTRGTTSAAGTSEGSFDASTGEGLDMHAAIAEVVRRGLPDPWLLGWSFGCDVVLRHGDVPPVRGAILLSPALRYASVEEMQSWNAGGRPIVCLIPEHDDYLKPAEARERFAVMSNADVRPVPEARHLWVGERFVQQVLDQVAGCIVPESIPLPREWDGPMERWSDLPTAPSPA